MVLQKSLKAAGSHRKRERHQLPNPLVFRKSSDSGEKKKRLQKTEPLKKQRQTAPTDSTIIIGQKVLGKSTRTTLIQSVIRSKKDVGLRILQAR